MFEKAFDRNPLQGKGFLYLSIYSNNKTVYIYPHYEELSFFWLSWRCKKGDVLGAVWRLKSPNPLAQLRKTQTKSVLFAYEMPISNGF